MTPSLLATIAILFLILETVGAILIIAELARHNGQYKARAVQAEKERDQALAERDRLAVLRQNDVKRLETKLRAYEPQTRKGAR